MNRLEFPLKDLLRTSPEGPALRRIWERIDERLPDARRRRRRVAAATVVLAALVACVAVTGTLARGAGPLRWADGRALFPVEAPLGGAHLELSDGSSVDLGAGALFDPLESSGTAVLAVVRQNARQNAPQNARQSARQDARQGAAAFDVRRGRRWQVECGLATVETQDARFSCAGIAGGLRVLVTRGAVVVRGERVADRARRLVSGEWLDVLSGPR